MTVLLDVEFPRTIETLRKQLLAAELAGATVEAWLFEDEAARRRCELRLGQAGITAKFRSAYKPLLHHWLEDLGPEQPARVTLHCPTHPVAHPGRFRLEAYPLSALVGDVPLRIEEHDSDLDYILDLQFPGGRRETRRVFAPNHVHADPMGREVLSPCGWLRITGAGQADCDGPLRTDYETAFETAMSAVKAHSWSEREPFFDMLEVSIGIGGIERGVPVPEETGWREAASTREALHEDLYFTLLEWFQRHAGREPGDRRLRPGQIIPDIRAAHGSDDRPGHAEASSRPKRAA